MATHGIATTTATAASLAPKFSEVLPAALPASKAAGIADIRISQVNGDLLLEELNAKQQTTLGFRLHALVDSSKKITSIAVTQMGSGSTPLPLTTAQRSALALIGNELKAYHTAHAAKPPAVPTGLHERSFLGNLKDFLEGALVAADCCLAGAEGGLNPIADVICVGGGAAIGMDLYLESQDNSPTTGTGTGSYGSAGSDSSGSDGSGGSGGASGSGGGSGSDGGGGFSGWGGGEGDPLHGVDTTMKDN